MSRRTRVFLAALAAALIGAPSVAQAAPAPSPLAEAAALRASVQRLQVQAEVASQRYDAIESRFGQTVTEHLLAQRQLQQARLVAARATSGYAARARALYEEGGNLSLVAALLSGHSLSDAASRYQDVVSILDGADGVSVATNRAVVEAAVVERRLARLAANQTKLQVAASRAAEAVTADLAQEQALLAAADAQVRQLAREEAAAAAAAAAANAAAVLQGQLGSTFGSFAAPNPVAATAIAAARSRLGDEYVWGGSGPSVFDCSGLTQWSYRQAGLLLPRVAADQYNVGQHVSLAQLLPGDLLFWATNVNNPATIHHVAMYLGGGMMIEAPHTGSVVHIVPVYLAGYIGATDPTAPTG
ncbi:MAG: C40 family peptidase [Mycobacteriales bacterium]